MSPKSENKQKLESFFDAEYVSLKSYVGARIRATTDRDPEDIVQDVALNLFAGADRYGPISNVAGFVYRSVKNRIIDILRKDRHERTAAEVDEAKWTAFANLMYGDADNDYAPEMIRALKTSISGLDIPYRDIIIAVDFEGYSYREISIETGTPEGTLMSRRHRAIAKLHKELKHKRVLKY